MFNRTEITDGPQELAIGQPVVFQNCNSPIRCKISVIARVGNGPIDLVAILPNGEVTVGFYDPAERKGWIFLNTFSTQSPYAL